jgi:peptide/nickel transport system ATP-binding protein
VNTPALEVHNLSVSIDTTTGRRKVVDDISICIDAAQATGLVGESGCGKSMTAKAIMGLLPTNGMHVESEGIAINGTDISALTAVQRRKILGHDISMVFQQPGTALDPVFTLGQQIGEVIARHIGGGKQLVRQRMLDALQDVGFSQPEKIAASYPHELSGGMQQLTMIAMATVCKPVVLIADEPTTALDSMTRALILQQLKRLQTQHKTAILLISHDLNIVKNNCQNVMVMYCGRLMEKSDCRSLFSNPHHPYSAGLLSCIPNIGASRPESIISIPGQVPPASNLPSGCYFAPRCNRSEPQCQQSTPQLESLNGSQFACFRPLS